MFEKMRDNWGKLGGKLGATLDLGDVVKHHHIVVEAEVEIRKAPVVFRSIPEGKLLPLHVPYRVI